MHSSDHVSVSVEGWWRSGSRQLCSGHPHVFRVVNTSCFLVTRTVLHVGRRHPADDPKPSPLELSPRAALLLLIQYSSVYKVPLQDMVGLKSRVLS